MFTTALYKKLVLIMMFPLLANCGHSLYIEGDGRVDKLCTLMAAAPRLSVHMDNKYEQDSKLVYLVSNGRDEITFDECADVESYRVSGFASLLYINSPYSYSRNQHQLSISIGYSEFYKYYFEHGIDKTPTLSEINIKVYTRNSCEEEPVLADEFNSEINWFQQFPNGMECGGDAFAGDVQIQSN